MDERLEEKRESIEAELESAKEQSEAAEVGVGNTEEAVADKTDNISKNEKNRTSRKKIAGYVELASAIILIILSVGLFLNTRGTRLLYVSVTAGRVSRYYWIFFLAAVVLGVIGLVTLRSLCRGNCAEKQQK